MMKKILFTSLVCLVLAILALALSCFFLTWNIFGGFVALGLGAKVSLAGSIIAVIFAALQVMGVYGHNVKLGKLTASKE